MDLLRRIKPAHLDLIQKIAENRKLQLAAEAHGISQPAASRILSEIETLAGSPLFIRYPKGMEPTPAGVAFVSHANVVLSELSALENELRYLKEGALGDLRIGSVTGPAVGYLMPAIQTLQQDHPDLQFSVEVAPSATLIQRLDEGRFDFILGRLPPAHDSRPYQLYPARIELVSFLVHRTHPLAGQQDVELSQLRDYSFVLQERGMPIRKAVEEAFLLKGLSVPKRVLNSSSLLVALAQIARAQAIAPQTQEVCELLLHADIGANISAIHMRESVVVPPYFIIRERKKKLSRAAEMLLQELLKRI